MELEEAISKLKYELDKSKIVKKYQGKSEELFDDLDEYIKSIETALNHLTKQDKMIELMAEHISFGKDIRKILCSPKVHGKDECIGITCKRCIKQYFEKKAEETE